MFGIVKIVLLELTPDSLAELTYSSPIVLVSPVTVNKLPSNVMFDSA